MKKTIILSTLLILFYSTAFSQDPEFDYYKSREIKTLLGRDREGGAYGAFTTGYSVIDDKHAVLFGGRFGFAVGASYRFPTSFDVGLSGTPEANAESIKGMSYTISLKFGKF